MKKAFSLVLALMLVLSLGIVSLAETKTVNYEDLEYGLAVGGVAVTSVNKDDIFEDGKAHYDPEWSFLYLNGVNLTDTMTINKDGEPIRDSVSIYNLNEAYGLHIVISGTNYLNGDIHSAVAVHIGSDETDASLTINGDIFCSDDWSDMYSNYSPLAFFRDEAIKLTVTGKLYDCDWNIFDPIKVPASNTNSVLNVNGVNNIKYNGIPSSPKVYLTLGMTEVTFQNADDIFDNGKYGDGKASYDWETNTLYLNGVSLDATGTEMYDSPKKDHLIAEDFVVYSWVKDKDLKIVLEGANTFTGNIYSPTTVHISADQSGATLTVDGDIICTEEHEEKNYSPLALTGTKKVNLKVTGNLYYEDKVFDPRKVSTGYTGSSLEVNGVSYDKKWEAPERTHSHDFDGEKIVLDGIKENTTETNPDTGAPVGSVLFALPILAGAAFLLRKKH